MYQTSKVDQKSENKRESLCHTNFVDNIGRFFLVVEILQSGLFETLSPNDLRIESLLGGLLMIENI